MTSMLAQAFFVSGRSWSRVPEAWGWRQVANPCWLFDHGLLVALLSGLGGRACRMLACLASLQPFEGASNLSPVCGVGCFDGSTDSEQQMVATTKVVAKRLRTKSCALRETVEVRIRGLKQLTKDR